MTNPHPLDEHDRMPVEQFRATNRTSGGRFDGATLVLPAIETRPLRHRVGRDVPIIARERDGAGS